MVSVELVQTVAYRFVFFFDSRKRNKLTADCDGSELNLRGNREEVVTWELCLAIIFGRDLTSSKCCL